MTATVPPQPPVQHGDGSNGGELALLSSAQSADPKVRNPDPKPYPAARAGATAKSISSVIATTTLNIIIDALIFTFKKVLGEGGVIVDAREEEEEEEEWVTDDGRSEFI